MREIRFRIWDTKTKEFRYSSPMPDIDFWKHIPHDNTTHIMQYAGLKDVNGLFIFEGDLVKISQRKDIITQSIGSKEGWIFTIYWNEKYCCFKGMNNYDDSHDIILTQYPLEIIGNIYEEKI